MMLSISWKNVRSFLGFDVQNVRAVAAELARLFRLARGLHAAAISASFTRPPRAVLMITGTLF